jgi:hypothetical protein
MANDMTEALDLTLEQIFLLLALHHPAAPGQLRREDGSWRFTFACVRQRCVPDVDIDDLIYPRRYLTNAVVDGRAPGAIYYTFTPAGLTVVQAIEQSVDPLLWAEAGFRPTTGR